MIIKDDPAMKELGSKFGAALKGGEVLELIGDVGAGKTTFVKGLALGMNIKDDVQSPSFTINRRYSSDASLVLNHYDFYRLPDAGIMSMEVAEGLSEANNITVIEWGESIKNVLPDDRIILNIHYLADQGRKIEFQIPKKFDYLNDIIE